VQLARQQRHSSETSSAIHRVPASKIANGVRQELQGASGPRANSPIQRETVTKRRISKLTHRLQLLGLHHAGSRIDFDPFEGAHNGEESEGYDSDGSSDTVSRGTIPDILVHRAFDMPFYALSLRHGNITCIMSHEYLIPTICRAATVLMDGICSPMAASKVGLRGMRPSDVFFQ
jgi:hypothetical protein